MQKKFKEIGLGWGVRFILSVFGGRGVGRVMRSSICILSCLCLEQGFRKLPSSDPLSLAQKYARLTPCFSQPFQMVLAQSRASTDYQQQRERNAPLGDCVELVEKLLVEVSQLASPLD